MMIQCDLNDRFEYCIGDDWSVHEILCVECPACGRETLEIITYQDLTLYYHPAEGLDQVVTPCTVYRGEERISGALLSFMAWRASF